MPIMETRIKHYVLPVPSTDLDGPVRLEDDGSQVTLSFECAASGKRVVGRLRFGKVRAYRHRAEVYCTAWHIEDAYDTLVEVQSSRWAEEIRSQTSRGWTEEWTLRHFMIYLDSAGCYELLADYWSTD